jgi:hypothetical protein
MDQLKPKPLSANVNVTLDPSKKVTDILGDKAFPCLLCGVGLPILNSKRNKPYLMCDDCGLQIFVRGKRGILRLQRMAEHGTLIPLREESAAHGISLLNRLTRLRLQKKDLSDQQNFFFLDEDIKNAISLVDAEIESVQGELAKISRGTQTERKT